MRNYEPIKKAISLNSPKKIEPEVKEILTAAEEWLKNNKADEIPMGVTAKNYADAKSWTDNNAIPFVISKNKIFAKDDIEDGDEEDIEGNLL